MFADPIRLNKVPIEIPVANPILSDGRETEAVMDVMRSGRFSMGRYVDRLEQKLKSLLGKKYALATNNGTSALHLALLATGINFNNNVVLVPSVSYAAVANAVIHVGGSPVFVSVDPYTWNADYRTLPEYIIKHAKVAIVVHMYGVTCDFRYLREVNPNIIIIEDAAEALGSYEGSKVLGTLGDIGVYSFFGNKSFVAGEGGALVTNNQEYYLRASLYRGQGQSESSDFYWHDVVGYNYRMTEMQAAIAYSQLTRWNEILLSKMRIFHKYDNSTDPVHMMIQNEGDNKSNVRWMIAYSLETPSYPLRMYLAKFGIETRPLFTPYHMMPIYSQYVNYVIPKMVEENLHKSVIILPSGPNLTDSQIDFVTYKLQEYFDGQPT